MRTPEPDAVAMDGDDLDPGVRQFIRTISEATSEGSEGSRRSHVDRRRVAEQVRWQWARGGPEMRHSSDGTCATRHGDVRLRIHNPSADSQPALVYLHGGGWTMFSVDTHDRVMREYAARSGCIVIGVDYALSPEVRYPIALEQLIDVLRWLKIEGQGIGVDVRKIAVGGDSAGANLAIAASLHLRDTGDIDLPGAMLLDYGAYSTEISSKACRAYGSSTYMLSCDEMAGFWQDYMRSDADTRDPLVCPLRAQLCGLPPAFLTIAECDILAEQNLSMAKRLRAAGIDVETRVYAGACHSFLEAVSVSDVSKRAFDDGAAWLRETLTRT